MTCAVISHPDSLQHSNGPDHPERPDRFKIIQSVLQNYPFDFYEPPLATESQLALAHDKDYIQHILSIAPKTGFVKIDEDTAMNPATLSAALHAAGAAILAVDLVMQGKAQTVFCNVRPPGHHAEKNRAMGFCFFNNVAIGARYAMQAYHLERVAIIDFDVHHGNGTQNIFQDDARVLLCSSFQSPFYPGYDPTMDNDHILSVPLAAGTSGPEYRKKVADKWFAALHAFKPQLIFFSAGFDAHENDPLASLNLVAADYEWITQEIAIIAKKYCQGKMISMLEGGYDLAALAESVPAHIHAMAELAPHSVK